MAVYNNHCLKAYFNGIHHFELKHTANNQNYDVISIDNVEYDGEGYDVTITISNLSDKIKSILRSHDGNFLIQFGRLSHAGTKAIASYQSNKNAKKYRSVKTHPSHYFKHATSFSVNIPSSKLNSSNTFNFYLDLSDLIGMDIDDEIKYRYKNINVAQRWQYLTWRIMVRMEFDIDNRESPYRMNSDEIIAYCNFY